DRKEDLPKKAKTDYPGMLWLGLGLLAGMFGATFLGQKDTNISPFLIASLFLIGVLGVWQFFRHIKRVNHPFLLPRFIYGRGFGAVNLINVVFSGNIMGVLALVPLFAANQYGISALNAAILFIAQGG